MIQPGLERITRLLAHTTLNWKAIHVAGTNGKGSICAAVSAMLHATGVHCGRFTSPHLIDRWDCININERPVNESLFREVEDQVLRYNDEHGINASEFELLTATAFQLFNHEKIQVGVVEVGMGGLGDATNVFERPAVTVISKIGLDHQSFLGNTIEAIAAQKAGIIKRGVPCIVDGTNPPSVLQVIRDTAQRLEAPMLIRSTLPSYESNNSAWQSFRSRQYQPHQRTNLGLAYQAVATASEQLHQKIPSPSILGLLKEVHWPGRTQYLRMDALLGRQAPVLIDGAHNLDSAAALKPLLPADEPVTWVLAMSNGKDAREILRNYLKDGDSVVATEFGPVDGMPWVKPIATHELLQAANEVADLQDSIDGGADVLSALQEAVAVSDEGRLIVTGSLYLISDVLRLYRDASPTHSFDFFGGLLTPSHRDMNAFEGLAADALSNIWPD